MDIYARLGVRPILNAEGTMTALGGSLMEPETLQAMAEAARSFVDLAELLVRAGRHIAALAGVEAACITSGAAAGLTIATAACIAGDDPEAIRRLPDCRGLKNEVIVLRSPANPWLQAIRLAGAELVEVGASARDWADAVSEWTAACVYFADHTLSGGMRFDEIAAVASRHGVRLIVDAAAELPPVTNLRYFLDRGADLAVFSGGKLIRGPQSTGLILGRAHLVAACSLNAGPNEAIGRPMKVGKEEIAGLVTAVERFVARDFTADFARWERQLARCRPVLASIEGVFVERVVPGLDPVMPRDVPRLYVTWDTTAIRLTPDQARSRLLAGTPSIAVGRLPNGVALNPTVLPEGDEVVVAEALARVLREVSV